MKSQMNPDVSDVKQVSQLNNLSHVFANSDLDKAQVYHEQLPKEARAHFLNTIRAKAGLGPDPGVYHGPPITVPSDDDTRDLQVGMAEQKSQAALAKQAEGEAQPPPLPPYTSPSSLKAAAKKPLGQGAPPSATPPPTPPIPGVPTLNPQLGGFAPLPSTKGTPNPGGAVRGGTG